jgi:hypothetical protein
MKGGDSKPHGRGKGSLNIYSKQRRRNKMLADYSDMEEEIRHAPELKILPRGSEVRARIINVREGVSDKNDAQWYQPVFDVPADPLVNEFNDFFWDLTDRDKLDEKAAARAMTKFKNFATAMGLDYSRPFDWVDDLVGLEGWVILGVKKSDEYGEQNTISKYVVRK